MNPRIFLDSNWAPALLRSGLLAAVTAFAALAPPAPAQDAGVWEPPVDWPIVAVHLLHHTSGEILTWAYDGPSAHLWNPATNVFTPVPNNNTNIFCSGHAAMANGLYMVAGGLFVNSAQVFDDRFIDPGVWVTQQDLAFTRFYPTCTTLPDGRILCVSGTGNTGTVITPEVYQPSTNEWKRLDQATLAMPTYPFMFQLPKGGVFYAGPGTDTYVLDVDHQTWTFVGTSANGGQSAVMYQPGRVMKSGGIGQANRITEVISFTDFALPVWRVTAPMAFARHDHNLTLLPDGTVLATGGHDETHAPVYAAELWNPRTETWTTLASAQVPRQYHSTAQLLIDGRVVSAGGDGYPSSEVFRPPYLYAGPRPVISSAPNAVEYAQEFLVKSPDADRIRSVNLLRLGAVTHSFDHNQRFVPLKFDTLGHADPPQLVVAAPADGRVAPPGPYMLFLINDLGVPSRGHYIYVR